MKSRKKNSSGGKTAVKTKSKKSAKSTVKNIGDNAKIPSVAILAVLVLAVIISTVAILRPTVRQQSVYDFGKDVANGIDVSEHNGEIDWEKVAESQDFAFIRVGYRAYGDGKIHEDERAKENLKNAQNAGIPFGVYFYSQAITEKEAEEEADFVFSMIKRFDPPLPIMIDFEYPTDSSGSAVGRLTEAANNADTNTEIINAFMTRLEEKGYLTGVYASSSVFADRINMKKLNSGAVIWNAEYNDSVTYDVDYDIWQYSDTGSCDGVSSKYVDLNYWYS